MQEEIIRSVLDGRDTLALLPTGGGKSLCFQVPALAMNRMCLVVSPLIALMKDQVERLQRAGISARSITSGMAYAEIDNVLESAALGKLNFLYVSPERLGSDLFKARLPRLPIGSIAVDEAHCISQWGYDFRPSYLRIREVREQLPGVPVIALTASATAAVAKDIMEKLSFSAAHLVRGSFLRPELALWVSKGEDKHGRLLKVLRNVQGTAIVYMRDRKGCVRAAQFLVHHGVEAEAYHAGLSMEHRDRIQRDWSSGKLRCVVATNAFGMGIDKADVRVVIHMDLPPDLESYYQEAGRGGRDGAKAYAFLLVGPGDAARLRERTVEAFPPIGEVRRVYQAIADTHGIAIGSGLLESYAMDLALLSERTGSRQGVVANALKVLALDGHIALSEGMRSPSRVMILAAPQTIHHLRVTDQRKGPVLEAMLRIHGGLFEEAAIIDEARIARLVGVETDRVVRTLQDLDRERTIDYRPKSDLPTITLLTPRQDAQRLQLDPASLRDREDRALARMEAMIGYVSDEQGCRARYLLHYFDEPMTEPCGQCDLCRSQQVMYRRKDPASLSSEPLPSYEDKVDRVRWEIDEFGGASKPEHE